MLHYSFTGAEVRSETADERFQAKACMPPYLSTLLPAFLSPLFRLFSISFLLTKQRN